MKEIVIVSAARTMLGNFNGALLPCSADELGTAVIKEVCLRAGAAPAEVDEVIMGNVMQAGFGQNPARQSAVHAGIPVETPATP